MEFGNIEFNNGLKESIYAYHIKEIHILSIPLSLKELKQKYIYLKNNKKLLNRLKKDNKRLF